MKKKILCVLMAISFVLAPQSTSKADSVTEDMKPYISLGADLTNSQKETVYSLLGVNEEDLSNYTMGEVTNDEEHEYLGDYISADVIGSKALSSVLVTKTEEGTGIGVDTHNITYCTSGMYTNALITAGIKDADVVVAGPFNITGTAALVGAMKAYSAMTGEDISDEQKDAATNELVVTSELAKSTGDVEKCEQVIALVKKKVVEDGLDTEEEISDAVSEAADEVGLSLTDDQKQTITKLMNKISALDIDADSLKEQAKDLYDQLSNLDTSGWWESICEFFSNLIDSIVDWFKSLF